MVTRDQARPSSEIGKADLKGSVIRECYGVGGRGEAGMRRICSSIGADHAGLDSTMLDGKIDVGSPNV